MKFIGYLRSHEPVYLRKTLVKTLYVTEALGLIQSEDRDVIHTVVDLGRPLGFPCTLPRDPSDTTFHARRIEGDSLFPFKYGWPEVSSKVAMHLEKIEKKEGSNNAGYVLTIACYEDFFDPDPNSLFWVTNAFNAAFVPHRVKGSL